MNLKQPRVHVAKEVHVIHVIHSRTARVFDLRDSVSMTPSLLQGDDGAAGNQCEFSALDPVSGGAFARGDQAETGRWADVAANDPGALCKQSRRIGGTGDGPSKA
ncbi:MAG: hypothetical protein M3R64_11915 [Pseudomonadota bacterium]|nr:hypothetical protein [Pseudomonadota bacterium]